LRSGEERAGVDLALPLVPTVSVSGVVIGPSGPVGNVGVRLRHAGESLVQDQSADVAATTTRADGTFHLPAVPAGNYVARVLRRPRPALPAAALAEVPAEMRAMLGAMGNQGPLDAMTLFAEMPLPLDRDVEGLTLALTTGATLSGRIVFEGAGSPPVTTNISVALTAVGGEWTSGGMPGSLGRAKEDGTFTTAGYPPGRYVVTPTGRAMAGWFPKSVLVNGRDALFEAFELEGRDLSNVVITYTDRRGTVSGTVQAPTAGADASASVIIFPVAWREWIAGGMHTQLTRLARTPAAGSFSIAGLPPREYFVVAVANTDAPDIQDPTVFEALAQLATTVSVSEGETRTITLSIVPFSRQEVLR
jgi:sarcosine oxidase gamma subunit